MFNSRLINTKVAGGGGGCTDIVDNYDPFGGNGVALYQLNGNATDVSGNNNGTATNITYGTGVFGQAGFFNGSSSFITLGTGVIPVNSSYSVSFWLYRNTGDDRSVLFTQFQSSQTNRMNFEIETTTGKLYFATAISGADNIRKSTTYTVPFDEWQHIVVTRVGTSLKFYVNGSEISTTLTNGSDNYWDLKNYNTQIGTYNSIQDARVLSGRIDQFRIFNTALTPLEVGALYTEELCICDGTVDTLDILGDGSCIATYQLDGNANDLSGNYSGTPVGGLSYSVGEFDLAANFGTSTGSNKGFETELNIIGSHSISLWANVNLSGGGIYKTLFWSQDTASRIRFFGYNDNALVFAVFGNQITFPYSSYNNTWVHLVCVINSANSMSLYVDGSLHSTISITEAITGTGYYDFGKNRGNASWYAAPGSIDQVRIFNKALSAGEVTTLYNETACTKAACTGTTNTLDILGDGSCVATYPLDGSPADLSGNYNGVQTNVTYPVGNFDLAGSFNGSSSYIDISSLAASIVDNQNLSISGWFKTGLLKEQVVVELGQYSGGVFRIIILNTDKIIGQLTNSSFSAYNLISTDSYNLNSWNHFVLTFNGSSHTLFLNNINQGSLSSSYNINTNNTGFIGKSVNSGTSQYYFNGSIDQVRIFNKALSAGEVTTLYNETPCN